MGTPVAVALVCATLLVLVHRYAWPLLDRLVAIRERAEETRALEADPLPESLVRLAQEESEEWAVEDAKRRMRELYGELRDWSQVRMAYMSEMGAS